MTLRHLPLDDPRGARWEDHSRTILLRPTFGEYGRAVCVQHLDIDFPRDGTSCIARITKFKKPVGLVVSRQGRAFEHDVQFVGFAGFRLEP
jgi:hypothetical protein